MRTKYTEASIRAQVARAASAQEVVASDPAYAAYPNAYRQRILDGSDRYGKALRRFSAMGVEYGEESYDADQRYESDASSVSRLLFRVAVLLVQAPRRRKGLEFDRLCAEVGRLLQLRVSSGRDMDSFFRLQLEQIERRWSQAGYVKKYKGSYPREALRQCVPTLKRHLPPRKPRRGRRPEALTYTQRLKERNNG